MTTETQELSLAELEHVAGGLSLDSVKESARAGFGLRTLYREAVKGGTAAIGGWMLANQMYGSKEHDAPWGEKKRAMRAIKLYLDAGDTLPSWAPNW